MTQVFTFIDDFILHVLIFSFPSISLPCDRFCPLYNFFFHILYFSSLNNTRYTFNYSFSNFEYRIFCLAYSFVHLITLKHFNSTQHLEVQSCNSLHYGNKQNVSHFNAKSLLVACAKKKVF